MMKLFIVNAVRAIGEALTIALGNEPDITISGLAITIQETLQQLKGKECDLMLVSTNLPDGGALQLTEAVKVEYPDLRVIILGITDTQAIIVRYIEAGAIGYLLREESFADLLGKLRAAAEERALVTPEIAAALIERVSTLASQLIDLGIDPSDYDLLTSREKEILGLIAEGLTNQEIADGLTIEIGTVKNHVHNILDKLNVHSRRDAAIFLSLMERGDYPE